MALVATASLAACAQAAPRNEPTPTATAQPEPTATPEPATPTPEPTRTPEPTPTPTAQPEPAATPTVEPTPATSPTAIPVSNTQTYELSLEIEGVSDESIVRGDSIILKGQTAADAIVSVNGVIVPVDETGRFEVPLALDEGPNQIDVVASDLDGTWRSQSFLVVSLPEEPTPTPTPSVTPEPTGESQA